MDLLLELLLELLLKLLLVLLLLLLLYAFYHVHIGGREATPLCLRNKYIRQQQKQHHQQQPQQQLQQQLKQQIHGSMDPWIHIFWYEPYLIMK